MISCLPHPQPVVADGRPTVGKAAHISLDCRLQLQPKLTKDLMLVFHAACAQQWYLTRLKPLITANERRHNRK